MTPTERATARAIAAGHPSTMGRSLEGPCIEWTGVRSYQGYGRRVIQGRKLYAHRLAWEEVYGPIPEGMCICHRCDNPPCVNVDHLFLGTHLDNMRDMMDKGRYGGNTGRRGQANAHAKLTSEQVDEIRSRYRAGGISQETLGGIFGVTQSHIWRIIREECWAPQDKSGVSEHPPFDATPVAGGEVAAAAEPLAPPFDDFHATVTSINAAADRLRRLKDRL